MTLLHTTRASSSRLGFVSLLVVLLLVLVAASSVSAVDREAMQAAQRAQYDRIKHKLSHLHQKLRPMETITTPHAGATEFAPRVQKLATAANSAANYALSTPPEGTRWCTMKRTSPSIAQINVGISKMDMTPVSRKLSRGQVMRIDFKGMLKEGSMKLAAKDLSIYSEVLMDGSQMFRYEIPLCDAMAASSGVPCGGNPRIDPGQAIVGAVVREVPSVAPNGKYTVRNYFRYNRRDVACIEFDFDV
jgi:hypothetical protein